MTRRTGTIMAVALEEQNTRARILADANLRNSLERYIRGKVQASEVDDLVQATLADALAAANAPEEPNELRRWVRGIARHKIADLYRGRRHYLRADGDDETLASEEKPPHSARDLLRWASKELPEGNSEHHTFEWMLREGSGEKLEDIAREQGIPAPRIRQRVSRLRRFLRQRWEAQVAAVAVILLAIGGVVVLLRDAPKQPTIVKEDISTPRPAQRLREQALEHCGAADWQQCLELLDQAAALDSEGDGTKEVREARAAARRGLDQQAPPQQQLAPAPTSSAPNVPEEKATPENKQVRPPPVKGKTTRLPEPARRDKGEDVAPNLKPQTKRAPKALRKPNVDPPSPPVNQQQQMNSLPQQAPPLIKKQKAPKMGFPRGELK